MGNNESSSLEIGVETAAATEEEDGGDPSSAQNHALAGRRNGDGSNQPSNHPFPVLPLAEKLSLAMPPASSLRGPPSSSRQASIAKLSLNPGGISKVSASASSTTTGTTVPPRLQFRLPFPPPRSSSPSSSTSSAVIIPPLSTSVSTTSSNSDVLEQQHQQSEKDMKRNKLEAYRHVCSEILPSFLYVSGEDVTQNLSTLQMHGITHIVNAAGLTIPTNPFPDLFTYKTLYLYDSKEEDLSWFFNEVIGFIESARCQPHQAIEGEAGKRNEGRVLIHCAQGVSRSITLAIAYVMWKEQLDFPTAFSKVKLARPIASPNTGFICNLLEWHAYLTGKVVSCPIFFRVAVHGEHDPSTLVIKACLVPPTASSSSIPTGVHSTSTATDDLQASSSIPAATTSKTSLSNANDLPASSPIPATTTPRSTSNRRILLQAQPCHLDSRGCFIIQAPSSWSSGAAPKKREFFIWLGKDVLVEQQEVLLAKASDFVRQARRFPVPTSEAKEEAQDDLMIIREGQEDFLLQQLFTGFPPPPSSTPVAYKDLPGCITNPVTSQATSAPLSLPLPLPPPPPSSFHVPAISPSTSSTTSTVQKVDGWVRDTIEGGGRRGGGVEEERGQVSSSSTITTVIISKEKKEGWRGVKEEEKGGVGGSRGGTARLTVPILYRIHVVVLSEGEEGGERGGEGGGGGEGEVRGKVGYRWEDMGIYDAEDLEEEGIYLLFTPSVVRSNSATQQQQQQEEEIDDEMEIDEEEEEATSSSSSPYLWIGSNFDPPTSNVAADDDKEKEEQEEKRRKLIEEWIDSSAFQTSLLNAGLLPEIEVDSCHTSSIDREGEMKVGRKREGRGRMKIELEGEESEAFWTRFESTY